MGAHVPRYHPRPDVVYLPLTDATSGARLAWRLVWLPGRETQRLRTFATVASALAA